MCTYLKAYPHFVTLSPLSLSLSLCMLLVSSFSFARSSRNLFSFCARFHFFPIVVILYFVFVLAPSFPAISNFFKTLLNSFCCKCVELTLGLFLVSFSCSYILYNISQLLPITPYFLLVYSLYW